MEIGCLSKCKLGDQHFYEIPTRKQTVSRNIKFMNQSDIVSIPVSEGPKNITWRKVLAMVLLLAFVIALVVTLILLLLKDESLNNTPKGNTTQSQTTSNTFLELNHTIETPTNTEIPSTTEFQTTSNTFSVHNCTIETPTNTEIPSTTEFQTTSNTFSEHNCTIGFVEEECKRSSMGFDYAGNVSVTQSGRICQAWNSQTPQTHPHTSLPENLCRNPDGELAPWCYTTDPNKRFDLCNISDCEPCPLECLQKNDPKGKKYFGTINVTKTGDPCHRWGSLISYTHRFGILLADQDNYCRNANENDGPWCFTTNADNQWEYCTIPHC